MGTIPTNFHHQTGGKCKGLGHSDGAPTPWVTNMPRTGIACAYFMQFRISVKHKSHRRALSRAHLESRIDGSRLKHYFVKNEIAQALFYCMRTFHAIWHLRQNKFHRRALARARSHARIWIPETNEFGSSIILLRTK